MAHPLVEAALADAQPGPWRRAAAARLLQLDLLAAVPALAGAHQLDRHLDPLLAGELLPAGALLQARSWPAGQSPPKAGLHPAGGGPGAGGGGGAQLGSAIGRPAHLPRFRAARAGRRQPGIGGGPTLGNGPAKAAAALAAGGLSPGVDPAAAGAGPPPPSGALAIDYCDSQALGHRASPGAVEVDGIAVSELANLSDSLIEELLAKRGSGAVLCSLVSWSEQQLQRVPPELFSSRWLVQAEGFELQPGRWGWRVKRLGDLLVAAALLLATAPLLLLAAAAIRLEDGGPVLYGQMRTGLYGQPYRVWKLRSMVLDAERQGARWARRDDPRITRVGQLLRRLRIDELPQLISVLQGDMSLIGPRPERPELEVILEQTIPHYRVRHWIKHGLSGWAQLCFPYGASLEDSRMKLSYDLYYLRNANPLLDLLILLKTIRLVSLAKGAIPAAVSAAQPQR